uniref:ATP phosphoribosyltransferase n=1 Tax=Albugo laibachii Nc14 TaxID=890382 RepID=F0W800_9STRA|nr:unnamed protein product [Albugo laibachii Nc14]|eukprot:CCA17253.1 unnamed protein product [Albugo laibachii Nc14]
MLSAAPTPENDNLLFAVPKKGRLHGKILELLRGAGIDYHRPNRVDIAICKSLPITLVFLPASDIATFVGEGNLDLGITGQDIIAESNVDVIEKLKLGFGKCRLSLQTPQKDHITSPLQLAGKRIVTSFPNITQTYFQALEKEADTKPTKIRYVSGSVEAACTLGLADAIVDLIETGTTMKAAGLELIFTILETEAVLIANPKSKKEKLIETVRRRMLGYLTAMQYKMITYNIHMEKLEAAIQITPGRKSPTINSLTGNDFRSISAMVERTNVADIMDQLHDIGATDIVTFDIENCRA